MSQQLHLAAEKRVKIGKNANRQLRSKGIIPAVFYNTKGESVALQVKEAALNKLYAIAGRTSIFTLEFDNNGTKVSQPCLFWDAEYFPTKQRFQHIDIYGVDMDKELKIRVKLEFTGTSKGVKAGGKLETYRDQIEIYSKPATLPKKIIVDITDMGINQTLRIADLAMPAGVRAAYDDNYAIITVAAPGGASDSDDDA